MTSAVLVTFIVAVTKYLRSSSRRKLFILISFEGRQSIIARKDGDRKVSNFHRPSGSREGKKWD